MGRPSTRILKTQRLSKMMTPSPHLSTSSLRPLHPATSHNNNNVYGLFVNSAQALCACHIPGHLEAYCVLSRFQWIHVDANILETMPRKMEKKKIVLVRVDKTLEREEKRSTDRSVPLRQELPPKETQVTASVVNVVSTDIFPINAMLHKTTRK